MRDYYEPDEEGSRPEGGAYEDAWVDHATERESPPSERLSSEAALEAAITEHYLRHGRDGTVADLAADLGWSEGRVRRALDKCPMGAPDGCSIGVEHRPTYSRDYPWMETGRSHKVTTYGPSRARLRELLRAATGSQSGPRPAVPLG